MRAKSLSALASASLALLVAVAAAAQSVGSSSDDALTPRTAKVTSSDVLPLGMSVQKVMNGIIYFWAFGVLFLSESDSALSDEDWQSLKLASLNLTGAATLITVPGTGPKDPAWIADPDWTWWAREMQEASRMLGVAVKRKNRSALTVAADRLADSCLSCHTKFKPNRQVGPSIKTTTMRVVF